MSKIVLVSLSNAMGMQLYCRQIANQLINSNEVSLIVTKYFDKLDLDDRVKVYPYFTTNRPTIELGLLNINSYRKTKKIVKDADVIHFLNSHPANLFILNSLKNKNTIFTLHDPTPHSDNLLGKCRAYIDKLSVKKVKKIILHSNEHIDNNSVKDIKDKCYISLLASKKMNDEYLPIITNNNFLFFGRIEEYKGLDMLINASLNLYKKRKDFKVTIAGKGDLNQYSSLLKNDCFEVLNYNIPEEEVKSLFQNCSFCILPYKSASQSGVIPLSYYYSRPVIVTNINSLVEVVESNETGIIVNNQENLENVMENILNNNYDVKKMSLSAYMYGNKKLSMEKMCKEFEEIYKIENSNK